MSTSHYKPNCLVPSLYGFVSWYGNACFLGWGPLAAIGQTSKALFPLFVASFSTSPAGITPALPFRHHLSETKVCDCRCLSMMWSFCLICVTMVPQINIPFLAPFHVCEHRSAIDGCTAVNRMVFSFIGMHHHSPEEILLFGLVLGLKRHSELLFTWSLCWGRAPFLYALSASRVFSFGAFA